jgi:D-3-phosphoglycerate dehydrogenase
MTQTEPIRVACLGFVFDPFAQTVLRRVAPPSLALSFAERESDISDRMLAESDVLLVVSPVTDAMLARAPRLRFIQKWGVGYDRIDIASAARRGIPVAITAGANAATIAEHAIALMLAVMRRIVVADRELRSGRWMPAELRPHTMRLAGKTVGLVGFGNIGKAVARRLRGFDVTLLYARPGGEDPAGPELDASFVSLEELLGRSDVVTLHCPGGGTNRGLMGRPRLQSMKAGSVLINVSRGDLVVEADLVEALTRGPLCGAGLDVFAAEPLPADSPLCSLDNVVLTPHSAGGVADDVAPMAAHAFRNIERVLRGEAIPTADVIVGAIQPAG